MHPGSLYRLEVRAITEDGDGPTTSRTFQTPAHQSIPKHSENSVHIKVDFPFHVSLKHRWLNITPSVTQVIFIITVSSSVKMCFLFKIFIICCCPLIQGPGWGDDTINSQSLRDSDCCRPIRMRACRVSTSGWSGIRDRRCHSVKGHVRSAGRLVTENSVSALTLIEPKQKRKSLMLGVDLRKRVFTVHAIFNSLHCPEITVKVQIPDYHQAGFNQ